MQGHAVKKIHSAEKLMEVDRDVVLGTRIYSYSKHPWKQMPVLGQTVVKN